MSTFKLGNILQPSYKEGPQGYLGDQGPQGSQIESYLLKGCIINITLSTGEVVTGGYPITGAFQVNELINAQLPATAGNIRVISDPFTIGESVMRGAESELYPMVVGIVKYGLCQIYKSGGTTYMKQVIPNNTFIINKMTLEDVYYRGTGYNG